MKDQAPTPDMMGIMYEKRALKRPRLGPPDVYPQEPRQKEDELTSTNVKHGFPTTPHLTDEFGTARNYNVTASKVGAYFNSILAKKEELSTLPDCGRKRQQINPKDNFWPATARTKGAIEAWFKDLAGSKPLSQLAKKAPNFNKKEEIFMSLTEHQVALPRAAWFIKLSSAYTVAVSEAKIKKRQLPDPTTEWTSTLVKFLKDQIPKLTEYYQNTNLGTVPDKTPPSQSGQTTPIHGSSAPGSTTPNGNTVPHPMHSPANISGGSGGAICDTGDGKQALRQWTYCVRLAKYLMEEALLERHDFLTWLVDLVDKRTPDDPLLKLFLSLVLQHMGEITQCELLARRLCHSAARKAAAICATLSDHALRQLTQPPGAESPAPAAGLSPAIEPTSTTSAADTKPPSALPAAIKRPTTPAGEAPAPSTPPAPKQLHPVQSSFGEILSCPFHKDVIVQLATVLQISCVECPAALVWSGVGEARSPLHGSPLDLLPVPPSSLPMPAMHSHLTATHRRQVYEAEQDISTRSSRAESKWCTDKWQTSSQARVLAVLEALDRHCFERVDATNNLDTLYNKVFAACVTPADTRDPEWACEYGVVRVLCEWAVSVARWGEHRAMAAAALLDRRQQALQLQLHADHANGDDKESVSSGAGLYSGPPIFQGLLMRFLDNDAPVLDEGPAASASNRAQFANLVHLFGELIRREVFSHDAYMCTLISRGDLVSPTEPTPSAPVQSVCPPPTAPSLDDEIFAGIDLKPKMEEHVRMDYDDSKIDDDLDKLLQHIKEDQQNSMDAPDSPKDPTDTGHSVNSPMMGPGSIGSMGMGGIQAMGMGSMAVPGMTATPQLPPSVPSTPLPAGDLPPRIASPMPTPSTPQRHLQYTTHLPLPPADADQASHDANQRHVLLYGVGKHRDDPRHHLKKITKEICKLFSKKFSIDVAEGGKIKKHSRSEFNFEAVTHKFQSMSIFEQHVVSWGVGGGVCEALAAFAAGSCAYLPQPEHAAFALDLLELASNVHGLIETCIQILKELGEVESALCGRGGGGLAAPRCYTSTLALYTVGALRRYHSCLLLCGEQTSAVFEQLCRLVRCVVNPGDCSSAERCVLAHLHDLYTAAVPLRASTPHHADTFANAYPKIRQALYSALQPTPSNYVYNPQFLSEVFTNPRRGGKMEGVWARQVAESPGNRYSFVCSAMLAVCREADNDRVNEIAWLCAEMTAWCGALAAEWLGALVALCGGHHCGGHSPLYPDLVAAVDLHDAAAHDSLAVFVCILVARHCFSLEDFVRHAALPSLLKACGGAGAGPGGGGGELAARLTCHLLLRLFKAVETPQPGLYSVSTSPHPAPRGAPAVRLSCDRHLLAAAHNNIGVGAVLATLKAILMVGDSAGRDGKAGKKTSSELSHILGTSDAQPTDSTLDLVSAGVVVGGPVAGESGSALWSVARRVLADICREEWVLQKCLQSPDELCQPDMLLDNMLTPRQAQRLLHMICYPDSASHTHPDMDQKTMITKILENLEPWSLRMSWLDLQLMFKQFAAGSPELGAWLELVARAAVDVFHAPPAALMAASSPGAGGDGASSKAWSERKMESMWLVAPLIGKLPAAVQGRVLKVAGQVLESGWGGCGCSHRDCKSQQSPSYKGGPSGCRRGTCGGAVRVAHEPLQSLVLTCLRGQDDQREGLLQSLHTQLTHALNHAKEERGTGCGAEETSSVRGLRLRLALLGGLLDTVRRSHQLGADWALLLLQLVAHGLVDSHNNSSLFPTVVDMLHALVRGTLEAESRHEEGGRKHYLPLIKKMRKELGERTGPAIHILRQLLPLPKQTVEVIACEPIGCLMDTKGNKITGFDSIDKQQGLHLTDKQRVSAWELVEGGRSPAPLSWAWFAATKIQRKPLTYENTHRLLKFHTHSLVKPSSYYLEPLPLPPEDLEPGADKTGAGSREQSPTGAGRGRGRGTKRPRKNKMNAQMPGTVGPGGVPPGGGPSMTGAGFPTMPPAPPVPPLLPQPSFAAQPQQWFQQQQQQQQQQHSYYNQQVGRVERPALSAQSKQALSNMLRQRLPLNQMQPQQMQQTGFSGHPRQPFPRQTMRPQMAQPGPQMNQMGGMGQMSSMAQMGTQMGGPVQMGNQMSQMSSLGQAGMGQAGMGQGGMSQGGMGQGGQGMFGAQQYGGMNQGYAAAYGQQLMGQQGGPMGQQMAQMGQAMNQGMGQGVNQMGQGVNPMNQGVNQMGQSVNQMGQSVNQMGQSVNQMGQSVNQMGQPVNQMGQSVNQMGQGVNQMGQGVNPMGQGVNQMGQGVNQMGQSMGQGGGGMGPMTSQAGGLGPQGQNAMSGFPGQQQFQQGLMGSQDAYMSQQRQNSRPQYMQAPNVTMGAMGGPAPPYPRAGMPAQQNPQFQQQMSQQRMRMLAMQQQSSGLVQHLQRSQQYQPPPY